MARRQKLGVGVLGVLVALLVGCGSQADRSDASADAEADRDTAARPAAEAPASAGLHALGQEPGWMVDITPGGELRVLARYGTDTITAPAPAPEVAADGARVYRVSPSGRGVTVTVEDESCRDAMSGKPFPMTVTLELDGEVFSGCGEPGSGG